MATRTRSWFPKLTQSFHCQRAGSVHLCGYFGENRLLMWRSFSQIRYALRWSRGWPEFREQLVIVAIGDAGCLIKSCRSRESQGRPNITRTVFSVSRSNAIDVSFYRGTQSLAVPSTLSRAGTANRLPVCRRGPTARTGRLFAALCVVSFAMPLKRCDPHDIAKDAQELDHGRISFDTD